MLNVLFGVGTFAGGQQSIARPPQCAVSQPDSFYSERTFFENFPCNLQVLHRQKSFAPSAIGRLVPYRVIFESSWGKFNLFWWKNECG